MKLFGKKKEAAPEAGIPMRDMPPQNNMPANDLSGTIRNMRAQGLSNNQIIQEMQSQGFNPEQIFDGMNKLDSGNMPAGPLNPTPNMQPQEMPMPDIAADNPPPESANMGFDLNKDKIEEMAEAIIDEKWEELVKSINKIIEWKDDMESKVNKIEQEIKDLKANFNQLHSSIIGKIHEYDKNIVNVGTEVKAMEKVFEKVLPTFTENVSELKRIIKNTKK